MVLSILVSVFFWPAIAIVGMMAFLFSGGLLTYQPDFNSVEQVILLYVLCIACEVL